MHISAHSQGGLLRSMVGRRRDFILKQIYWEYMLECPLAQRVQHRQEFVGVHECVILLHLVSPSFGSRQKA